MKNRDGKSSKRPALKTPSMNLPLYWLSIHSAFKQLPELAGKPEDEQQLQNENLQVLLQEVEEYPIADWAKFCDLSGLTVEGFVTTSWCEGASWKLLMQYWNQMNKSVFNLSDVEVKALKHIHSKFIPEPKLSQLISEHEPLRSCGILIHALQQPIEIDLPQEKFNIINDDIKALIKQYS